MASTFDALLRLELQATGENANTWGDKTNNNLELIATAIAGAVSISIAGSGTYTLSTANAATDEARRMTLNLTGLLTGARTVVIPSNAKLYVIRNATTGSFTTTVKTATGAGVIVPQGFVVVVMCDGTDCYLASETDRVSKAGDVMTGTLSLPAGTSVSASQALRSDEVDARVSVAVAPFDTRINSVSVQAATNASAITSINAVSNVQALAITSINSATTSINSAITSINSAITSINNVVSARTASITSINSAITSVNNVNTSQNSSLTSINSAITSINAVVAAISVGTTPEVAAAITSINNVTTSINSAITSINAVNNTQNSAITSINSAATSTNSAITSVNNRVAAVSASVGVLNLAVTSINTVLTSVNNAHTSTNQAVTSVNNRATSINSSITSINSAITSINAAVYTKTSANAQFVDVAGDTMTGNLNLPSLNTGPLAGFRNAVINGNFVIWQRATSFANATDGTYTADRWLVGHDGTGATRAISRQDFTLGQSTVDGNPRYFYRFNQSVAGSGGTANLLWHRIENVETFSGRAVTVTFWAKAASGITLPNVSMTQHFGTGGSPSSDVITSFQNNVVIGTGWAKYTYTATLASTSGKTRGTDGNDYLALIFSLPLNTTFTFDLAQVQLEIGSTSTPFEDRLLGIEQLLCQRFYQTFVYRARYDANNSTDNDGRIFPLPVTMRVPPTVSNDTPSENVNVASADVSTAGVGHFGVEISPTTSGATGWTAAMRLDAEL